MSIKRRSVFYLSAVQDIFFQLFRTYSLVVVLLFHHHDWARHVFCFSQPSPGLHHSRGLYGTGPPLRWLRQLRCVRLPLRVRQDLHEDHVLCWYSCCCKCFNLYTREFVLWPYKMVTVTQLWPKASLTYTLRWVEHCNFLCFSFVPFFLFPANWLLQPADWSVHDPAGYVHGDVWHWESEGPAALSLLPQANWRRDELWLPHGSSYGSGPALPGRGQVRCSYTRVHIQIAAI